MQTVGERVEVGEAGGHTGHDAVVGTDRLDLVEGSGHDVGKGEVVLPRALFPDLVDLGLRVVDEVVDLTVPGVADLCDTGADLDQATQDRAVGDDLGVVAGVGGGRDRLGEGVQVKRAPHPGGLATLGQFGVDRDRVDRFPSGEQVDDRLVDDLVRGAVEVRGVDDLHDLGDGVLRQEHATKDALFGLDVMRRCALVSAFLR